MNPKFVQGFSQPWCLVEKRQSRSETNRPGGSAVRETALFRDRQSVRSAATVLAKNLRRPRAVPEQMKRIGLALVLSTIATACAERGLPTASGPQPRVTANHVTEGSDIELSDERLVFGEVAPGESATQYVAIQNVGSEDLGRWTHSLALMGARLELQGLCSLTVLDLQCSDGIRPIRRHTRKSYETTVLADRTSTSTLVCAYCMY